MKKFLTEKIFYILLGIFCLLLGILIGSWSNNHIVVEVISVIGTISSILFTYLEVKNSKEQFVQEHAAKLQVYTSWEDQLYKPRKRKKYGANIVKKIVLLHLHIIPVNVGLDAGKYRFFGICQYSHLNKVKNLINKIKNNEIDDQDIMELTKYVSYANEDVGDKDDEMSGINLVYPKNKEVFQTIEGKDIGKILDREASFLKIKLNIKQELVVIYVDPTMKGYFFNVKPYKTKKSAVTIKLPVNEN